MSQNKRKRQHSNNTKGNGTKRTTFACNHSHLSTGFLSPIDRSSFRNSPTILCLSAGNTLSHTSGSKAPQRRGLARMAPTGPNAPLIQGVTCLVSHLSVTVASLFNKCLAGPLWQLLAQLMSGQVKWQLTQSSCCLFFPIEPCSQDHPLVCPSLWWKQMPAS